jgi:EAL domain-containing protein (putative c-di-GMP-specific phosphodiesterase class I)
MFTVAESVETPEEAAYLRDIGVACQQGYLYGAPTVKPPWSREGMKRSA